MRMDSMASRAMFMSLAVSMLVGGSALAAGAILGFLFGIPRAMQEPQQQTFSFDKYEALYQVNTNLEQISDWLTKIIIGISLIQIRQLHQEFKKLSEYVAAAFGPPQVPASFTGVVLVYFGITGFLTSYLWTRILLTSEFSRADRAARQSPEFYEGLIHALLYQPPPDGFRSAIEASDEFMKKFGEGNWRVWRSIACAYGQKFKYLSLSDLPAPEELDIARKRALAAVKRVLALNPEERESIRALWDPKLTSPQENDLVMFFTDEDFKKLLSPEETR
jgi:type III secretory pathway component EscS